MLGVERLAAQFCAPSSLIQKLLIRSSSALPLPPTKILMEKKIG